MAFWSYFDPGVCDHTSLGVARGWVSRVHLFHRKEPLSIMKRKRRVNQLDATTAQVVKLSEEACPSFEEAERLFYAEEKSKNRLKRTIEWHQENIRAFKTGDTIAVRPVFQKVLKEDFTSGKYQGVCVILPPGPWQHGRRAASPEPGTPSPSGGMPQTNRNIKYINFTK